MFSALAAAIYIHWCNSAKWRHDSWRNLDSRPSMFTQLLILNLNWDDLLSVEKILWMTCGKSLSNYAWWHNSYKERLW